MGLAAYGFLVIDDDDCVRTFTVESLENLRYGCCDHPDRGSDVSHLDTKEVGIDIPPAAFHPHDEPQRVNACGFLLRKGKTPRQTKHRASGIAKFCGPVDKFLRAPYGTV